MITISSSYIRAGIERTERQKKTSLSYCCLHIKGSIMELAKTKALCIPWKSSTSSFSLSLFLYLYYSWLDERVCSWRPTDPLLKIYINIKGTQLFRPKTELDRLFFRPSFGLCVCASCQLKKCSLIKIGGVELLDSTIYWTRQQHRNCINERWRQRLAKCGQSRDESQQTTVTSDR